MGIARHSTVYDSRTAGHAASTLRASGANSVTDVVIPAGQEHAIIGITYYSGTPGQRPTSVTLDGQAASLIVSADGNSADLYHSLYFVTGFSSGSGKTLAWSNPVAMDDGVAAFVSFFTGGDLSSGVASLVRSSGGAQHATHPVTSSLSAQTGDLAIMGWSSDVTTITLDQGSVISSSGQEWGMGEFAPSGNTAFGGTGANVGFVAVVMKPAAGGAADPVIGRRIFILP